MIAGMVHPFHTGQKAAPNLRMGATVARRVGAVQARCRLGSQVRASLSTLTQADWRQRKR